MKWLHRILNPHCPHCKEEEQEARVCKSCEILQYEIERLRSENDRLLSRLLEKPEPVAERISAPVPVTRPNKLPWAARRQMLEAEDRERAKLMAQAPKPAEGNTVEELEKELDVAGAERESQHTANS